MQEEADPKAVLTKKKQCAGVVKHTAQPKLYGSIRKQNVIKYHQLVIIHNSTSIIHYHNIVYVAKRLILR